MVYSIPLLLLTAKIPSSSQKKHLMPCISRTPRNQICLYRQNYTHCHFSFFFFSFFFNFTILYWFCHLSTWIRYRYTLFPILNPPPSSLPLPSLWVIPVHQPQASSIVHQTWTGDSFHIYYTCFNAILPNHPTLVLSHRVQKTVLHISVSFAVSYTGLLLPSF